MNRLNQQLFVVMQIDNKHPEVGIEKVITISAEIYARETKQTEWKRRLKRDSFEKKINCPHLESSCDSVILVISIL